MPGESLVSAHLYGGLNVYTGLRVGNRTLHSAVEGIQGSKRQSSQPNGGIAGFCVTTVVSRSASVAKAQLWGLLVVASYDPNLGSEKRTDERKLVDVEARQLGGCDG